MSHQQGSSTVFQEIEGCPVDTASPSKLRIAVSSSDGRMIDEHFGSASQFVIVELRGDEFVFVETRPNQAACGSGSHVPEGLAASAALLKDCQLLLTARIGLSARSLLEQQGVKALQSTTSIESALQALHPAFSRPSVEP